MLPGVNEYFRAIEAAEKEYDKDCEAVRLAHPMPSYSYSFNYEQREEYDKKDRARGEAQLVVDRRFRDAREKARQDLSNSSGNPIAKFIATRVLGEYDAEGEIILRALPLTRAELESLAREHDWCRQFRRFMDLAEEAGVFGKTPYDDAIRALTDALAEKIYGECYADHKPGIREILKEMLPGILDNYSNN